jgi:hypothetical protein
MAKKINVTKMSKVANIVTKKLEDRVEKALADAEELVKQEFPARYVSASLTRLKKTLYKEGIECDFDYKVSRAAIRKTANSDITKEECDEAVAQIAEAVVDEVEEILDQCAEAIDTVVDDTFEKDAKVARFVKRRIQMRMARKGLNFKF